MAFVHHSVSFFDISSEGHCIEQWRRKTIVGEPALERCQLFRVLGKIDSHPFIGVCRRRDEIRHLNRVQQTGGDPASERFSAARYNRQARP